MKSIAMLLILGFNAIGLSSFVHAGHCGGSHSDDTAQNEMTKTGGDAKADSVEESESEQSSEEASEAVES